MGTSGNPRAFLTMIEIRTDDGQVERYYRWDEPDGLRIQGAPKDEYGCLEVSRWRLVKNGDGLFKPIIKSIPKDLLELVHPCATSGQYETLTFLQQGGDRAVALCRANRNLTLALAIQPDRDDALRMLGRKWREMVDFVGLPGGHATAKLLRKLSVSATEAASIEKIRMLSPRRRKVLSYIEWINIAILNLARDLPADALSPAILTSVLPCGNPIGILEIIECRRRLGLPLWPWKKGFAGDWRPLQSIWEQHVHRARRANVWPREKR